jgi:RND family efflux transporter MFP subunit
MRESRAILWGLLGLSLVFTGCNDAAKGGPPINQATEVVIGRPTISEVTDYEEFTGHTDSINSVQIKSRATGYLLGTNFELNKNDLNENKHIHDGEEVKVGELLYEIDDRPYRMALDSAESSLAQAEAHLKRVDADYRRAANLYRGANIGKEEFDLTTSNYSEGKAAVGVARAALEKAKQDYEYTKIHAPMSGMLSRSLVDPGNLIVQGTTILNDIVQPEKLYVYFDINEAGMKRVSDLIRTGRIDTTNGQQYSIEVGTSVDQDKHDDAVGHLQDLINQKKPVTPADQVIPPEFPYKGLVNFSENTIDAATGTLRIRGIIDNPAPYILSPGLFVRVHLPIGKPHTAVLIPSTVIGSDQGRSFIYVINSEDEVVYRPVTVGPLFNGLRSITEGLNADERLIFDPESIRRVRPGSKVVPITDPKPAESSKIQKKAETK